MNESFAIWGASGHARVVADAARLQQVGTLVGFIDDDVSRKGEAFEGTRILGGREILASLLAGGVRFVHVAIGHCGARLQLSEEVLARGLMLRSVVHPWSVIAGDVSLGAGCFVAAGVVVNAGARIGRSVILNTSCSVDHECVIEDGAHVGPGSRLGGIARMGRGAWLGIGAVVKDRVQVGEASIVGAGSVVVRDVPGGVVAYGVPARVVRAKKARE